MTLKKALLIDTPAILSISRSLLPFHQPICTCSLPPTDRRAHVSRCCASDTGLAVVRPHAIRPSMGKRRPIMAKVFGISESNFGQA